MVQIAVARGTAALLACTLLVGKPCPAQQPSTQNEPYLGLGLGYVWTDEDARNAKEGYGVQLLLGRRLAEHWNVELTGHFLNMETGSNSLSDFYRSAAGIDVLWLPWRDNWSPYALAGLGAAYNDVYPSDDDGLSVFGNIGLGVMSRPLGAYGIRLRAEARYVLDRFGANPKDVHAFLGVGIPLRRVAEPVVRIETREVIREVVRDTPLQPPQPPPPPATVPTDSDHDGVVDASDRCPGTLAGTRVDADGCIGAGTIVTLRDVLFATGSAQLDPVSTTNLLQIANTLKGQPSMRIELRGYTDSVGDAAANLRLSAERTISVADFLVMHGIDRTRIETNGLGEEQPVADNSTADGRSANRRVELHVTSR